MKRLLTGLIAAGTVARAARSAGALTESGSIAASAVGALVYRGGGVGWCALLLLFFGTSSSLSRLRTRIGDSVTEKSGPRDAWQVAANGGVPAAIAFFSLLRPSAQWSLPFAGALSCATADTWATEVGSRAESMPRSLISGRRVPVGTSGGVTWRGTAAAVAGASLLAGATRLLDRTDAAGACAIAASGFLGCLADSLLGAAVQEQRSCPSCGELTEQHVHRRCGVPTEHAHGVAGLGNDAVNALSCGLAAGVTPVIRHLFQRMFDVCGGRIP